MPTLIRNTQKEESPDSATYVYYRSFDDYKNGTVSFRDFCYSFIHEPHILKWSVPIDKVNQK